MTEPTMPDAASNTTDLFEIIRTIRSMRRLKLDPVPNELVRKILEAVLCAPSGRNMQRWRFLVIRDAKIKQTVGAYYKRAWDEQVAPRYRAGEPAPGMSRERLLRLLDAAEYLAAHIHEAPVWIVPCLEGGTPTRTSGSSIYPAVQNMLLAARALGLGATKIAGASLTEIRGGTLASNTYYQKIPLISNQIPYFLGEIALSHKESMPGQNGQHCDPHEAAKILWTSDSAGQQFVHRERDHHGITAATGLSSA